MYRHSAESIRETDNKMFVSLEEKTKFNNYENILRKKDDSYSKTEVDNKIKELSDNTYGMVEDTFVSEANTIDGYIKDLEILGNTIQDTEDLSDIKSVGELQEDGTYKMSIVSCGKNLFDGKLRSGQYDIVTGVFKEGGLSSNITPIKIRSNTIYFINRPTVPRGINNRILFYDKNMNYLSNVLVTNDNSFITPSEAKYFNFHIDTKSFDPYLTIQIEEGTVATSYEPYQESRVDINLPCQLEKVGGVSDRLYYDKEEKAWCIEKNIEKIIFTGSDIEGWAHKTFYDGNGKQYYGTPNDGYTFKVAGGISEFPVFISGDITRDYNGTAMTCSKTYGTIDYSVNIATLSEFKTWVNGKSIYVVPETSKKIILPLSTQIQLNSYANKTHIYTVSGEVDGTIKATLPKSLGANVQSLNDKTDMMIDRIKNVETLKEGQNLSYESDKGYVVCENTNNGQIDNIKIEGKTLVNLSNTINITRKFNTSTPYETISQVSEGQIYTLIVKVHKNTCDTALKFSIFEFCGGKNASALDDSIKHDYEFCPANTTGTFIMKAGVKSYGENNITRLVIFNNGSTTGEYTVSCLLLEGDHTQNPPKFFEGLLSVGGDVEKIELISRKEDGNLFEFKQEDLILNTAIDLKLGSLISSDTYHTSGFFRVTPNNPYSRLIGNAIYYYDKNFNYLGYFDSGKKSPEGSCYARFIFTLDADYKSETVIKSTVKPTTYIPYKSHNKSLLYYNNLGELVPVPELHEWDSIEKHSDGKWYYHKRSGKIVFDGSSDEDWKLNTSSETTQSFRCAHSINMIQNLICDRFVHDSISSNNGVEGILVSKVNNPNEFSIEILKTKLSSVDVTGFKTWLSSNNVTVLYELAEEEVYECVNLNLDTYDNETMVMCNSGAISPNISFNVSSHIGNTVSILRERLKSIEEEYTQYKLNKDRLLLNARYKSDKGSFNVSIISLSSNEEEIDYELFALTKSVIELSLNKIDIVYMENLIDFYTLVGKFDYDMADVLFEMIENQINPAIEIPEEEISIEI